ncbi:MAG: fibronectin type III domain-containing protein [[Eubacterium] siraeum]
MKKKFVRLISAVLSAAMTLTAVPLSAFAEGEAHTHDGESNVITTPLDFREKTADENGVGWSWDYDTKTLTLDGVNIQATTDSMSVVTVPDGTEIVLNGNNTIVQTNTDDSDTYVLSAVNTDTTNCDGTMTISGDGVLNAENRSTDSMARSLGGTIILNGGTVNATGTVKTNSLEIHNDGVLNANATTASFEGVAVNVSRGITVDGNGSLTAVGCANESTLNSAILLTSNFDKISVSENGSITVPEGNAARVGIYYSGNNGDGMDAEISGGKVTAYGTKYGIYKVNLIMSGTGSVYTTGGSYAIGQTLPEIDMDELIVRGSADFKAEESAVTGEVKYNSGYYEIGGADAKTVVIKPDTSPRIILGKQTGIFKTEEYEIIEGETDTKLKGTVYFDITLKNMSDEEFADARGCFGGDEPDLSASIIKTDYGWVCMVCDTEFSVTYDTDNTLTIKCGDIVSNTVQVKSNANRFNKVTQGDNTNRTVFYTNTSQEEKDNYKLVSTYTVDSESISYNWYSTNSAYSADELGAAVSGSNGEFKLADNIPAGNYVLYCDITYSDGDSTETVTEKFTFTYKECAHENGYSDGKCTNCGALCDHSDIDIDTGKCNECAHQLVATISTDGNAPTGYDTLADCLDSITADTGNYVKIYQDIGDASATAALDTIDVNHNVMIDLNGHKLNNIKLGVNKDVTLTLTGTAGSYVKQVYVRKGGSFIIDSVANVEFDTIFVEAGAGLAVNDGAKVTTASLTVKASVNDDGTTTTSVKLATGMKIGGLTYWRQDGSGLLKLGNLLDVTRQALQYDESGEYHDLYKEFVSKGLPVALTVVEHTDADHKYGSGTGRCEKCGKPCEHGGDINTDNGICSICGAVVSVALYTSADGNLSSYLDADGLDSILNEYNGSGTIKLFKDYSKPSAQYDLYGELTIDVNGRQFNIRSITPCKNGKLTIKNSGNPVMLGCNVYPTNDASYAGGTLIIDGDVVLDTSIYVYDSSTVILKAGAYPAGLYARDSKTLYDMLGEGKAFFKTDGTLFNANVKEISSSETLTVKDHSHTYVDGECGCGYVCPHSDVNSETGKCNECEYQYAAVIVKDGAVASVYEENEMGAAFKAADSDTNTGCTLKVYKNYTGSYTTLSGKFTLWIAEEANVGTLTVSGDITVTGSEKNNNIYGDFNVADGGKLTFDENCGAMGTVSVGAGTFDCYHSLRITLNINDASSDVILHGGTFIKIRYNGGGDRANAEILTLLAENRMFMKSPNPESIDGSKTLLKDGFATTVIVIPHEDHSYDSTTGKCTICGKRCGHTDVDSKTGVCSICEYQLTAGVSGVGTAKYFDNIDNAFVAALSEVNSGCTLTLYKDCELSQNIVIGNATVTVDMNGHSILLAYRIKVNDGGVLYLKNSRENGSIDTEIEVNKGGTLINGTADDSSSAVSLFSVYADAAKCVEIYGGSCTGLTVNNGTSGIALYGGSYELIHTNDLTDSTPVSALLAKGYAFVTLNSVTHLPESIVDGSAKTIGGNLTNVMVVAHTHTYTETNTKCACGAVLYAKVTSADGTTNKYFDSIDEGLLYADKAENKGCVFTLVTSGKINSGVTLSSGQFTIATATTNNNYVLGPYAGKITIDGANVIAEGDMEIRCKVNVKSGSLTLPEGSSTGFDSIAISGGTVTISEGVNADSYVGADNLFVSEDATDAKLTIGGGTYGNVDLGQFKLKDVIASGVRVISYDNPTDPTAEKTAKALLYSDIAEKNNFDSENGTVSYYLVTKCEHKNEDGSYAFNDGVCKYCNSEFAASVSYTDGGEKTELFGDIYDAFDKANEAGTATITLCRDIADSEIAHEINVTGNLALELNTKTLGATDKAKKIYICGSTLTVNGNGKVWSAIEAKPDSKLTITNGEYNDVYALSDSEVVILDGIIDCLSVYGTGKAEVSGGKFKYLFMYNGKAIESVLADGYAYKNADGTWLSIDEREKDSYLGGSIGALSVEEAPIKSASIAWVGEEAPVIYRNGEKYLYVDITYELAVGSKGATYSDFVNGNNRIKDYNLYNKYMVHCYEIGKLAAKDGEVEYYIVLKCNGYEYKSNVLKLTLATCSHPKDSFSYENNGLVICGICDALIEAEVVDADGKSLGYADIESAIKLAQENEGSTVKLMSEGVSSATEFTTVTGGRFTVDFNGKKVFYQFAVNGGDVTFTSSVKQADVETLISGITVNGTDAKVTIDGKIKLGSVTLTSGALKINSAESYIKELSIIGGNAVIDNAIIGALQTNGGDTVINCVEANSLSININGSGSISIVTGTFYSTTCKTGLGMAIASGSRVYDSNMNGAIIYTYDAIQTMTKTDRIFVDKCVHKDGKGSYVLDGNPCPYCSEEIVATVSYTAGGSEETDLFSDICDAFDKANEIGTATVTLYKDITDDITDTIAVTGNVTLELNGKRLSQPGTDVWYSIEVTSGKLTVNGSGLIKRVAVRNGSNAEINGGTFSDFIIKDGGNAVIKGGQFYSLQVSGEGRNVGQLLADGYAYWRFIDSGIWSTIAEREKQDIANVEVKEAPIKSATITAEDESPIIYRNGRKTASFTADVTYTGNETLYVTGCLIDGTVIKEKTDLSGNRYYLFSGEVDKAVAEDGEIQYYCIFTYDGYEYKSNAVTLTVATCQHPGASVKCDDNGNYVCGICNRALTASVELSDGMLSYYGKWNDAISAAQESEGCTLKLLNYSWLKDNETFDISKGRFTVDLNKNDSSGPFAFNVKGGDITFTALKKASISFTGVTVSGENANVLIDSKATLNYLVVNSGKVSADGANIGAITINGGDTVINDVNADYLSMKADTTGGSGYNVSIVSGTFNIFTCENESNYTLGRAIASGSRVIGLNAIVGSGFKYAEIQSMTKANYLTVIKCDHKDENDSYALDGNLCPYCNEEIAATVSYTTANGGEQTDLFSDIYDAFAKANEAGTATVTLYKDITNSELTQGVTITGNVTLALNGKKLGGTFAFNAPVEVSDGGMFTVGGDGKMRMPIKAYANSKLIINGGEFTSVMVYIDGDAEIGGGVIDALTIIGNAKAKISGGKFYNIEIANGSLESVLADGYAYKKDGGAWLSIAERAESVYSSVNNDNKPVNVEEAPIKSATLSTEINKLYRNSNANPTLKFNLALAHGSNLNDSYVSKRYGINSYVSGDIIYSSLSALVKDAKLSADEIIDKAGNSVAAKIYFVVITDDGYEIKSNTVSIDLVDCDHSQVVDPTADKETAGNITEPTYCEICESKFNAKITKGDDVKYYNDLDEAAKDAQKSENEGCTLYPLYNKNGYGGQLVITEGNFTLKYAVRTAFSRPIIINGKAKLTVTGRCAVTAFENQDAFIVRGGDVTFDGLATGSNVTINGGNVTMAANNINCLTIHGGNVSISSGGFAEIVTTVSDKVIADYIDHGFWVQDRGTKEWIDIYSLNKATASSTSGLTVRVCPMQIIQPRNNVYYTNGYYPGDIPSLQISAVPWYSGEVDADVAYQWIGIDENGNETEIEGATDRKLSLENLTTGRYYCRLTYSNATTAGVLMKSDVVTATVTECEHSGGEATCTKKAKCEICGAEYGEPLGHDYVVIKVVEPDYRNEGYSVFECTRCKDSYIGNRVPVKPIPDVEEIAVEKTTYNEVDISWKNISGVDGFNVECYVGDQWKQINCSADGDRVAAKLSGLSAGLKYKVRIAAYAGSFTGKFRYFYVDTVPSPVWNINTVKATDETVRISWSRNTRADGYKVEWYIDNQWSAKTVTGNNNIAAVIDGLCAGTRYKVRVSAYKGDLYSPYTYGYINTLPSKVTGITQTVTSSSFTLKWDKNESADGYTVQYYADGKWNEKSLVGNDKTTVTIGSLKGYKTYKVRIKAYKGELQSTFDDIYITTAPTKVDGLKVKSAVDSKAVVIWNADATADGYNVGYYIGGKWVEKTITDNKTAMAELDGLTPYSTYKVRVRAYKDNLYGDYSYTTVTAVLSPVTDIKVVSAKSNSITVKWGKNASADGYKVEIYKGGKWVKKTLKGSTNATVTIGGLRAGSVYKVRIASYKGANTSAYTYANVNTAK